jgi:NAD(P)-dependent dehydrogenase (short-subunit alcohol dehydrogenase family)
LLIKVTSRGFFLFAQKTLPLLLEAVPDSPCPPTIIITGATASVKGSAQFGTFATGKFGLRALGQSLAREFGPKGVHVAHAIIDGGIDTPWGKDVVVNNGIEDGKIKPEGVGARSQFWFNPEWVCFADTNIRSQSHIGTYILSTVLHSRRKSTYARTSRSSRSDA